MFLVAPPSVRKGTSLINEIRNLGLTSGLQLCLDAGDANSYPGSGQTVSDLSGNGNNFALGDSTGDATNDPAFNGVAGRQSSSEYFAFTASAQRLTMLSLSSWVHTLHKDNATFTWASWRKVVHNASGETFLQTVLAGSPSSPGITIGGGATGSGADGQLRFVQCRNTTDVTQIAAGPSIVYGWGFYALSYTESTGAWIMQANGTQQTGTQAYVSPSTSSAPTFLLENTGSGSGDLNVDVLWTTALSATSLNNLFAATRAKFGV